MGLLDKRRVHNAIQTLTSARASAADRTSALAVLRRLKERAAPELVEALASHPDQEPLADALAAILDNSTLPAFRQGLASGDTRLCDQLVAVMSRNNHYDPNLLLDWFLDPGMARNPLIAVLSQRKDVLQEAALVRLLQNLTSENQAAVFRLLESVATAAMVPLLLTKAESDQWQVRLSVARTLARFRTPEAIAALTQFLSDSNKSVRLAALEALAVVKTQVDLAAVAGLLRDPDLTVQARAIEVIIEINDPRSVHYLLDILQDESEYVRRAAVEVLNEVGNTSSIKDLLEALRDRDWWVRVRAADALGTIGGPKVVDATLDLLRDGDEFIRRCAIEILNTTGDPRAFEALIEALADEDWWVRERAVDALGELGDKRAVPALIALLQNHPEASAVIVGALGRLEDPRALQPMLQLLEHATEAVSKKVLPILPTITTREQASEAMQVVRRLMDECPTAVKDAANEALGALVAKFGETPDQRPAYTASKDDRARSKAADVSLEATAVGLAARVPQSASPSASTGDTATGVVVTGPIDPTTLKPGETVAGRYRVLKQIKGGAFGVVVLVEDEVLSESVILKFLRPHLAEDKTVIKRFMQELRYARKISHENVIRIHDFLDLGGVFAISMEYFDGETLAAEIARVGQLGTGRALTVLSDTCAGLIAAHHAGIVHRDLKPANILLNQGGQLKIVDFGLAAAASYAGSRITTAGMAVGTPSYMSPEQIKGQEVDARADIYALGVILYEMLAGTPPYVADDAVSLLYQHLEGHYQPLRERIPDLHAPIQDIIDTAMAKEPGERYQTCEQLREALSACLTKGAA